MKVNREKVKGAYPVDGSVNGKKVKVSVPAVKVKGAHPVDGSVKGDRVWEGGCTHHAASLRQQGRLKRRMVSAAMLL